MFGEEDKYQEQIEILEKQKERLIKMLENFFKCCKMKENILPDYVEYETEVELMKNKL